MSVMWRSGRIPCQGPTPSAGVCYAGVVAAASTLGLSYGEPPLLGHLSWRTHCLCSRAQIKRGHTDAIWYCTTTWRLRRHTGQKSKTHMRQTIGFTFVANISIYFTSAFNKKEQSGSTMTSHGAVGSVQTFESGWVKVLIGSMWRLWWVICLLTVWSLNTVKPCP